ncbi:hypothetical protein B0H17DRAFT_1149087 [Mycena rosella]|uniref:DnaJ homologue subfamily C member 28 conserved domain-containing protein n=1 Tax=Mycena rosella TaxID=1033263 RepID=A0AAD7C6E2_MYCRO|nr:hypothetical protein B0H17DRAFT_1149087 [Mycena rosella]
MNPMNRKSWTTLAENRALSTSAVLRSGPTGSAKLFADAEEEEALAPAPAARLHDPEQPNWTGDERVEDTILRMLVDKYKPLRTGTIQTADQKLRKSAPRVQEYHPDSPALNVNPRQTAPPPGASWSSVPLLPPGPPDHRPWHTEFKVPAHATPSIRTARFPLPAHAPRGIADLEQTRKTEKALNKTLGRLSRARESTLDYRLGLGLGAGTRRVNPVNMKGWTSLIEDKIEQARRAGLFASIKGRGRPLQRAPEEANPFLPREEFLMNRIVRRNGAAPPWVQLQADLDASLHTFRHLLRDAWTRHAVRALTLDGAPPPAPAIEAFRDAAWAAREASYHTAALAEVNGRVRAYNALAPYAVRRPLYVLADELARVYRDASAEVVQGVAARTKAAPATRVAAGRTAGGADADWAEWVLWARRLRDLLLSALRRLVR